MSMNKFPFFGLGSRDVPQFYQEYLDTFHLKKIKNLPVENLRFVVFDTETTGIDVREDRILSIGAVVVTGNSIEVAETFEVFVEQDFFDAESVPVHGIMKKGDHVRKSEEEAVKAFLKFIGSSVLVGHHVGFDIGMINYALKRLGAPKLKNRALDTGLLYARTIHPVNVIRQDKQYTLDEVCEELKIDRADRHKAAGDAYITALAFLKIRGRMEVKGQLTYKHLTR